MEEVLDAKEIEPVISGLEASPKGIERLLSNLGYTLLPEAERELDKNTLIQQKDLRERVDRISKLFSMQAKWTHPESGQVFDREANALLFELKKERELHLRFPFEMTRYVARFSSPPFQGIFFFIAPNSNTVVATAYSRSLAEADKIEVRRLTIELENITRTDKESVWGLKGLAENPATVVDRLREALPHLKVGSDFFIEYHTTFQALSKRLKRVLPSDEQIYGFSQRLLGKVTFLYFLQRKGWLNKEKAYLKNRRKNLDSFGLFDFLYKVFEKLNTIGIEHHELGRIPYLNGTLFEPDAIPDGKWKDIRKACAPVLPQILDIFDAYNFTISESTPLDKEVAVDPELLGSILESMLPEVERGDKGTFYTHQGEMLFMAKEALRSHLLGYRDLLSTEQMSHIIYDVPLSSEKRIEPKEAREIKDRLKSIRILDPAVGSGGFLMAVLQVLVEVRHRLNGIIGSKEQDYDIKLETIERNLFGVDIESEAVELARLRLWLSLVVDESIENVNPLPNLDYNLHQGDSLRIPDFEMGWQANLDVDPTMRKALLKEIQTVRESFISSHGEAKERMKEELESALAKLLQLETGTKPQEPMPFSYRYFFPDVIEEGGFDIVLMNPPYIRHEDIGRLPGQNPDTYKTEITEAIRSLTNGEFKPLGQSDISVYFHVRGLSLLKRGGVAVVIASSKWLDVRYGVPLQEYMMRNHRIDYVFDSMDRSFSADINTAITIIRKGSEDISRNTVHFVLFNRAFSDVSPAFLREISTHSGGERLIRTTEYRMTTRNQGELLREGVESEHAGDRNQTSLSSEPSLRVRNGKYVGIKWGNIHFYAPDVYYELLERGGDKLKRLDEVCKVTYGSKTGCNDIFVLERAPSESDEPNLRRVRNGLGYDFMIESELCPPLLRNPDEFTAPFIESSSNLSYRLFYCQRTKKELKGSFALKYIEWAETSPDSSVRVLRGKKKGERVRVYELDSVKSRMTSSSPEWYRLPQQTPMNVFLPKVVKNRHLIPRTDVGSLWTDNFYAIESNNDVCLWLYLSSSVFRLFMELNGRSEGAGALQLMKYEYEQCPTLASLSPSLTDRFRRLKEFKNRHSYRVVNIAEEGPLEFEQDDRLELDHMVLKEIGFTSKKDRSRVLRQIYSWLESRVRQRLEKPRRAPSKISGKSEARKKGLHAKLEGMG